VEGKENYLALSLSLYGRNRILGKIWEQSVLVLLNELVLQKKVALDLSKDLVEGHDILRVSLHPDPIELHVYLAVDIVDSVHSIGDRGMSLRELRIGGGGEG
jgi:hypothetical protein